MAPKPSKKPSGDSDTGKKHRKGFRVGPDNLPDGAWKRKGMVVSQTFLPSYDETSISPHIWRLQKLSDDADADILFLIVTKIKNDLIHKAKVKKAYAKIKDREQKENGSPEAAAAQADGDDDAAAAAAEKMHPTRELMIKDEEVAQNSAKGEPDNSDGHRRRTRRPGYYDKQLAKADERRALADQKTAEREARMAERNARIAEREKFKRAMAKTVGRDGKKKLGRESGILLDKVKKMVANK